MNKKDIIKYAKKSVMLAKNTIGLIFRGILRCGRFLRKHKRSALFYLPILLIFYYAVGSVVSEKIDKDPNFEIKKVDKGYIYVQSMADLIKREIDEHVFTPNLPFIFPASVLDNMPAFQKGIIKQVGQIVHAMAIYTNNEALKKADDLLSYPAEVWLFSKTKDFKIEPSSVAQYRKARRQLLKFNDFANRDNVMFEKVLDAVDLSLTDIQNLLETQVYIKKSGYADDVFYFAQGRLYAVYVVLKSVGQEFDIDLDSALRAMEKALKLNPFYVKNGVPASFASPNHLLELAYFTLKSQKALDDEREKKRHVD